jgi:hypothetical protein
VALLRPRAINAGGKKNVGAENRLTAEQLAALRPGESVTVESGAEFGRRRYATASVVRVNAFQIVVSCEGPRGGKFVELYGLRDGIRAGGSHGELVNLEDDDPANRDHLRRKTQQIDNLYREWSRRRSDVVALRELRDAISKFFDDALAH